MPMFRKKPIVIEATQFTKENGEELAAWCGARVGSVGGRPKLWIDTLEGVMKVNLGDYVIKGAWGEFYPCARQIFEDTYDEVEA